MRLRNSPVRLHWKNNTGLERRGGWSIIRRGRASDEGLRLGPTICAVLTNVIVEFPRITDERQVRRFKTSYLQTESALDVLQPEQKSPTAN